MRKTILCCAIVVAAVFSPLLAEPGVSDKEVLIGSSYALSGPAKSVGLMVSHGLLAYIKSLNAAGGVHGRTVKTIEYDDEYNPMKCIENTKKLIETDGVFALTSYVGTPTAGKAMPVWKNAKVPMVGIYSGYVPILRNPLNRYSIHVRGSHEQEMAAIVSALVDKLKFKKIAIYYQYDSFGESIKKNTESELLKRGLTPVASGPFDRTAFDAAAGVNAIKGAAPEAIIMVGAYGTYDILATFMQEYKKTVPGRTIFCTLNLVGSEEFAAALKNNSGYCFVSEVVPSYDDDRIPIVMEYKEAMKRHYPKDSLSFAGLEAFINAKVLVEGMKKAGKDLTREGFINAVESLKNFDMGGVTVTYGGDDHEGMDSVYLVGIKNGKFYGITDWAAFAN